MDPATIEVLPAWKQILVVYGPLGILALAACIVAYTLYKDRKIERAMFDAQQAADRKNYADMLKAERAECERERREGVSQLRALEEKYVERSEKQLEKYHELAKALNQVLDSAMRRYPRNTGGADGT